MKLRIKGDSVRLRLTRGEVSTLQATGLLEDRTRFAPGGTLTYRVREDRAARELGAAFEGAVIEVRVPAKALQDWAGSETEVTLAGVQRSGDAELAIVVEKDFACLTPRPDEDESDNFPHPMAGQPGKTC
jgi:hypothetical protein